MTHTSEVFVEQFDVSVDDFENGELIVALLHGAAEVETGVSGSLKWFKNNHSFEPENETSLNPFFNLVLQ